MGWGYATLRRVLVLAAASLLVAACSAVPNLDWGSAGCQNASGIGPIPSPVGGPDGPIPAVSPGFADELIGKPVAEAAAVARAKGQTVVFNVQTISRTDPNVGYGECWCEPPPGGHISDAWWGQHGALSLMVRDFDPGHDGKAQPFQGWGC